MGRLVEGEWIETSIITSDKDGSYDRLPRTFRETISNEHKVFQAESGRYHLYVSLACPWAHRCLIYRKLKGLEEHISVSVVHPDMLENGWTFEQDFEGATGDSLYHCKYLYEIYQKASPDISTSVTVPILWDKKTQQIVNNESSEIIRILNKAFNKLTGNELDLYPDFYAEQIDAINDSVYEPINNGVYRTGFAKTQQAYQQACKALFKRLDELDHYLQDRTFLVGEELTEADIRLVPTLLRFDLVYYVHFKCNWRRISDYGNLAKYTRRLFELEAIRGTTNFEHIKRHYYFSHEGINPYRIIPVGPADLWLASD